MTRTPPQQAYRFEFEVTENVIDQNGHVNNVAYVQWMQDAAVHHSDACGGSYVIKQLGTSWVVRSHTIDYLSPAFAGDRIVALTWVADFRKVRSRRSYIFLRSADNKVLARGETDWVYVDAETGRPLPIPDRVRHCFPLPDDQEDTPSPAS